MPDRSSPNPRHRVMVHGLTPARKAQASEVQEPVAPAAPFLVGHGYDIHRLEMAVGERKLVLGGIVVSQELSAVAHSDGDVILHALADAFLGALGLGDIGEIFPDSDPRWHNAPSGLFIEEVYSRVRKAGYRLVNADITLMLESPKIGIFKPQMIESLKRMIGGSGRFNIKAGTNEGCDSIGRGEAVAAHAVVLLAADA